jgi:hypothetical protein
VQGSTKGVVFVLCIASLCGDPHHAQSGIYCSLSRRVLISTSPDWVRFVIRASRPPTSRRGSPAVLTWRSEQSRSGGELLQGDQAYRIVWKPSRQSGLLGQDTVVIRPVFLCPSGDGHGLVFFCYQLLTP